MPLLARSQLIESLLVRRAVDELETRRHTCVHCHRSPLVGERIYRYTDDRLVCELCRPLRREQPARSHLVMPAEHAGTIRLRRAG